MHQHMREGNLLKPTKLGSVKNAKRIVVAEVYAKIPTPKSDKKTE